MKHIHILGICGTFMGSLAQLAKSQGYTVTGSDRQVYPPMSTQLEAAGIELINGFEPEQLSVQPDLVVVGNVISRGNPVMEAVMNRGIPYTSGPQWLAEHLLHDRWVLAVAGTHGKTTTASLLAWILEDAGMAPGYLIGGVPQNFSVSARLGSSDFFVVEADEYDTAFFDKRSKFVHYRPRTLILNNLEFDHADIFPDLAAIQTQFYHLLRTVPSEGLVIWPESNPALQTVVQMGCWAQTQTLGTEWQSELQSVDGSAFDVLFQGERVGTVTWTLNGSHNVNNALAALAAARHVGVEPAMGCAALCRFMGVKRRMETVGSVANIVVYDDFAHHPTAIRSTLAGLRAHVGDAPITAVIELRSNTMKQGVHKESLVQSCDIADYVFWLQPEGAVWDLEEALGADPGGRHSVCNSTEAIINRIAESATPGDHIVIMSNGGFDGIHQRLLQALRSQHA